MRANRTRQTAKLRLLAFVLAVALTWYSINPAPEFVPQWKTNDEPPEAKRRERPTDNIGFTLSAVARVKTSLEDPCILPDDPESPDDFEWPEFIDA
jgi:hypothetical protein